MINAPFVAIVHRGLVNGARCLISGREFASIDPADFESCWQQACNHALAVVHDQDTTVDGRYQPQPRSLQSRRNLWEESQ